MILKSTAALCFGLVLAGLAASPADAQSRQRGPADATYYQERGEDGRVRTKVIIQRRSFLDGGTEVSPGSMPSTNNVMPFGYSPMGVVENTQIGGERHPLPSAYDLIGKDNPYPFQ